MEQLLNNPHAQTTLTILIIGAAHALCMSDIVDAFTEGERGKALKQVLIEGCLIFLTWQGFIAPTLLHRPSTTVRVVQQSEPSVAALERIALNAVN